MELQFQLEDLKTEMARLQRLQKLAPEKRETNDDLYSNTPTDEPGRQTTPGLQSIPSEVFPIRPATADADGISAAKRDRPENRTGEVDTTKRGSERIAATDNEIIPAAERGLSAEKEATAQQQAAIDQAAHEAATSPKNDLPEPSQKQKESGVYRKGHLSLHGLDIAIENPQGSIRRGVDPNGKPWSVMMRNHYGAIRRTEGADGDNVDVYLGDKPGSEKVFVIDQVDKDTGRFDEHKVILDAADYAEAKAIYDAHFSDGNGHERRSAVTEMTLPEFKDWLKNGDTTKPLAQEVSTKKPSFHDSVRSVLIDAGIAEPMGATKEGGSFTAPMFGAGPGEPALKIGDHFSPARWVTETNEALREWQRAATGKKIVADVGKITRVNTLLAEGLKAAGAGETKTLLQKRLEVGRELNRLNKTPLGQAVVGYMKAQVLLALHIVTDNLVSNAASLAANEVRRPAAALTDALVSRVYGTPRRVAGLNLGTLKEAAKYGATQGLQESWQMLRYGTSESQLNQREAGDKYTPGEMNILPGFNHAANFVFRLMGAGDKPFFATAFMGAMHGQARLATKKLAGKARRQKIQELLLNPPPEMVEIAQAEAREATFNRDNQITSAYRDGKRYLEEEGGTLGKGMSLLADALIMFDKVPTNVVLRGVEMTGARLPFRVVDFVKNRKAGIKLTPQEQAAFAQHVGDGVTGLLAFVLGGAGLAMAGMLSGDDENRVKIRNAKEAAGEMDSSLRLGDVQVNLNKWGGPAGKVATTSASVINAFRSRPGDEEKSGGDLGVERSGRAATNALKTVADLPLLRGVQDFTDAVKNGNGARGGLKGIVEAKATSLLPIVGTGLMKEIGEFKDDYRRDANGSKEKVMARLPGVRERLPRQIDALGNPVKQRNPITDGRMQVVPQLPDVGENLRLQVGLSKPKKGTPEEKAIQIGKANANALEAAAGLLPDLSTDRAKREVMTKLLTSERSNVEAVTEGKRPLSASFVRRDQERMLRVENGLEALREMPTYQQLTSAQKKMTEQSYRSALRKFHGRRGTKEHSEQLPDLPMASDIRAAQRAALRTSQKAR